MEIIHDKLKAYSLIGRITEGLMLKAVRKNRFRNGRNCHQDVERAIDYAEQGYKHVVDVEIKEFFDNIPHDLIVESAAAKISDGNILKLIKKFLNSGVLEEGKIRPTTKGTPQGGAISPLLSNIVLDYLN